MIGGLLNDLLSLVGLGGKKRKRRRRRPRVFAIRRVRVPGRWALGWSGRAYRRMRRRAGPLHARFRSSVRMFGNGYSWRRLPMRGWGPRRLSAMGGGRARRRYRR